MRTAVVCCCVPHDHTLGTSEQYCVVSPQWCGSKLGVAWSGSLIRVSKGRNQGVAWTEFLSGGSEGKIHFQVHSYCWQNPALCDRRAEVPLPCWLAATAARTSRGRLCSLPRGPLRVGVSSGTSAPSPAVNLLLPLLWPAKENSLLVFSLSIFFLLG